MEDVDQPQKSLAIYCTAIRKTLKFTTEKILLYFGSALGGFNANPDPDLTFYLNVDPYPDPDPGSQTKVDPCGSGSGSWSDFAVTKRLILT
jgi:hypothetical protein